MTKTPSAPNTSRPAITRRRVLIGLVALGGPAAAGYWFNVGGSITGDTSVSVQTAFLGARNREFTLIDIRRPDEWTRTGIGVGAIPIDMRNDDFITQLLANVSEKDAPIALICARGVRSRGLGRRLAQAGFTNIIDVPEGMLGSGAGPGWLGAGLPVTRP